MKVEGNRKNAWKRKRGRNVKTEGKRMNSGRNLLRQQIVNNVHKSVAKLYPVQAPKINHRIDRSMTDFRTQT